jgi:hypothetical protein
MKKKILLVLALIAILAVTTGPAAAKATKTEFSYTLFVCSIGPTEKEWFTGEPPDGPVYHWRGQASFGYFSSNDLEWWNGTVPGLSHGDVKYATFTGNVHGTFVKQFDNEFVTGTFEGTWGGKFTNGLLAFSAHAHGTGDLAGMKYSVDLVQLTDALPDDPCPGGGGTAYAASAVLLELPDN